MILEAVILASALSMDSFVASFAYGSNKIKIPMSSVWVIDITCGFILGVSLFLGSLVRQYIPPSLTTILCFLILMCLGMIKLLDSITKSIIRKYGAIRRNYNFSLCNFRFVLNLYADPEAADVDNSKVISPKEAASLSLALSLDGIAVGFGAALVNVNGWAVVISALIVDAIAVMLGAWLGNKIAKKLRFNISWVSGIILIIMAVMKLM